jgi:hypothetical protein
MVADEEASRHSKDGEAQLKRVAVKLRRHRYKERSQSQCARIEGGDFASSYLM